MGPMADYIGIDRYTVRALFLCSQQKKIVYGKEQTRDGRNI